MDPFKPHTPTPRPPPARRLSLDDAETVALNAVAFIVADEDLLSSLMSVTGCGVDDLRHRVTDRAFLGAVLGFLLTDEATVLAFAAQAGLAPETPMQAQAMLVPHEDSW